MSKTLVFLLIMIPPCTMRIMCTGTLHERGGSDEDILTTMNRARLMGRKGTLTLITPEEGKYAPDLVRALELSEHGEKITPELSSLSEDYAFRKSHPQPPHHSPPMFPTIIAEPPTHTPLSHTYSEELEINDYPQRVRWKVTYRDGIQAMTDFTGCAITVRGMYLILALSFIFILHNNVHDNEIGTCPRTENRGREKGSCSCTLKGLQHKQ